MGKFKVGDVLKSTTKTLEMSAACHGGTVIRISKRSYIIAGQVFPKGTDFLIDYIDKRYELDEVSMVKNLMKKYGD